MPNTPPGDDVLFRAANLRLDRPAAGTAVLWLDTPGRPVNLLGRPALADIDAALDRVAADASLQGLVIASLKPTTFLAGADVHEFAAIRGAAEATELSAAGQRLFDKLESLRVPSVAVVCGPCLGGGLELALACDYRVAVDHPRTQFGLPEIELGLLPAWGGTQRLPRAVGVERALQVILGRRRLNAREARRWGLADHLVPFPADAVTEGRHWLERVGGRKRTRGGLPRATWRQRLLESTRPGRALIFRGAERILKRRTPDDMPAPWEALEAVRVGLTRGPAEGFRFEREAAGRLAVTPACRNLVSLFLEREAARKLPAELADVPRREVRRVGVVGAGTMGAGIAQLAALKGFPVVLREVDEAALGLGLMKVVGLFQQAVARGVLTEADARGGLAAIKGTTKWEGFGDVDLVVEAVVEDLEVKRRVFRELEANTRPDAVLATNTSSLRVAALQEGLAHPGRVAGLHFFNPVHKLPLVEVVHAPATDPSAVATLTRWALALGKTPVVVRDSPGFVVNRVLVPYLNEAVLLVAEGMPVEAVDEAARRFGMLAGPLEVLDQVGLDVAAHVARTAEAAFRDRFPPSPAFEQMCGRGWLGQKSGAGFYRYGGRKRRPHRAAEALLRAGRPAGGPSLLAALPRAARAREATERMILLAVNEAAAVVGEGLVAHPDLVDRALVFGSGWAPHRGGPLRYADDRGLADVVNSLRERAGRLGPRFEPCPELVRRADRGERFRTPLGTAPAG